MVTPPRRIPLSDEAISNWQNEIARSDRLIDRHLEKWKALQADYVGAPLKAEPTDDVVCLNTALPRTKSKVAQLYYQVPKLHLKPKHPQYAGAVAVHQAVLNHYLADVMHVERMVDEVLTDVVAVSGIGVSKIGYESASVPVEMALEGPEEQALLAQQGLPPTMEKVDVPIHESYFWERVSPAKVLLPADFAGTDFHKAPWLGFRFRKPWTHAKREWKLQDEDLLKDRDERRVTDESPIDGERSLREVECIEIWYKASLYDEKEVHPLKQRRLVFVEGVDTPVVHEDSPYQRFDPDGRLVIGSACFPIHILVLTTVPDEGVPPSDAAVARSLTAELQSARTQMILQRKLSLPMRWYLTSAVDPDTAEKFARGEWQGMIPLNQAGESALGEVARANYPRENFEFNRVIAHDLQETWGMGSNQLGSDSPGEQSATEVKAIQGNTNVRLDYERTKVLRWFLQGAEMVSALLQLFADEPDYVEIVGPDRAKQMVAWDRQTIRGEFVFEAQTNSQLRLDVAQERMDARNAYQLLANDPFANRQSLVAKLAETHDLGPEFVVQPPPKQPDPPNVSFRFAGEDLNPLSPAFDIVLAVLAMGGFQIPPEAINAAKVKAATQLVAGLGGPPPAGAAPASTPPSAPPDTTHGGPAKQAQPLSKHGMGDGDYR